MATFNEAPYESEQWPRQASLCAPLQQDLADVGVLASAGDADGMEKMIQLNLNTPMRLCHHLSKPMVEDKKGVIIDIASIVRSQPDIKSYRD